MSKNRSLSNAVLEKSGVGIKPFTTNLTSQKSITRIQPYPIEFKESAIKLALESDEPTSHVAQNLGIHKKTLYNWIHLYYKQKNGNNNSTVSKNHIHSCIEENRRLKTEISKVTQERDLLKKAAAYFAREVQ